MLYLAWAWLGHSLTGKWTTPLLDPEKFNALAIVVHVLVSLAVTLMAFLCVLGLHELRHQGLSRVDARC